MLWYRHYRANGAMHVVLTRYCYGKSSVCLSVSLSLCPSVTLWYREHRLDYFEINYTSN